MPLLLRRAIPAGAAIASLAACSVLLPVWVTTLDSHEQYSHLWLSPQGDAINVLGGGHGTQGAVLERLSLNGEKLQTQTVPLASNLEYDSEVLPLPDGSFYVFALDASRVSFYNPTTGLHWSGFGQDLLAENEIFYLQTAETNSAGQLVFSGRLQTRTYPPAMRFVAGVVGQDGVIHVLHRFPEFASARLFKRPDGFSLQARYTEGHAAASGHGSAVILYDENLQNPQINEFDYEVDHSTYKLGNYLVSRRIEGDTSRLVVLNLDGSYVRDFPDVGFLSNIYPGKNSFYTLSNVLPSGNLLNFNGYLCNYSYGFEQRWCRTITDVKGGFVLLQDVKVTGNDELTLTYSAETKRLLSLEGGVVPEPGEVEGEIDGIGEMRFQVTHLVYTSDGKKAMVAKPTPYSYRGDVDPCLFGWCVEASEITPGVISNKDTLPAPGGGLFALNLFCRSGNDCEGQLMHWKP